MKRCANCGGLFVFGKQDGEHHYCDDNCRNFHRYPGFCPDCESETTSDSPGGTVTLNGVGTRLYGNAARCPTCASVIKRLWFCVLFIPVIPFKRYRIKPVTSLRYLGRLLPRENLRLSESRVASASR